MGPLPLWAWLVIATILALAYYLYQKNKTSSTTQQATTAADQTPSNLIPQFVNQTYTSVTPPSAPSSPGSPVQIQNVPSAPFGGASVTPGDTSADFGWGGVPGASSYKLVIYKTSNNQLVYNQSVNGTHASVSTLSPNTSYKFQVVDPNTGESTPWKTFTTKKATTASKPAPKTAPATKTTAAKK